MLNWIVGMTMIITGSTSYAAMSGSATNTNVASCCDNCYLRDHTRYVPCDKGLLGSKDGTGDSKGDNLPGVQKTATKGQVNP